MAGDPGDPGPGPTITISFKTAEGIEAGKTKVKYKDVTVGTVEAVSFEPDLSGVILTVEMDTAAESLLNEATAFWVERPRITLQGVSGLGTLVSGAYLKLDHIGDRSGGTAYHYEGWRIPHS